MEEQPAGNQARPTVACLRCREQKLKCDRELPSCDRCRKQKAVCTYPAPPDRKRIAQTTNRAKASQSNSGKHVHRSESSSAATNLAKKRRLSQESPSPLQCLADPEAADLPSTEIGLLLSEVYFKRIYNATLMFHKTVAFQVYMLNKTPVYLQRAIFAHGAMFLQDVDSSYQKYIKVLPMQSLYEKSWSWAHAASVEVLSHVDEPSVLKVQTLQVLQLYYYARGEITRAKVHASLAYQLSQLLGYDKWYEDDAPSFKNRSLQFDREIRRRSYWASWSTMCLGCNDIYSSHLCGHAAGLPLPAKFGAGGSIQGVDLIHGQKMSREWRLNKNQVSNDNPTSSLMAELMKLLGVWNKIRVFVSEISTEPNYQKSDEYKQLSEILEDIGRSMDFPIEDLLTRANSYDESPELLASVSSVYHLSRIIIHASSRFLPFTAAPLAQMSSSIVLNQALRFAELLQYLIDKDLEITRLWPFTGYAAFMVAKVFLSYNTSAALQLSGLMNWSPQVPGPASDKMKAIQLILEILSIYWKPLRNLATNLNEAIEMARSDNAGPGAAFTFPWEYINSLSDGEPDLKLGNTTNSSQAPLS